MGCDIHPVVERRMEIFGWVCAGVPCRERNYGFFAGIAAVRGNYDTPEVALAPGRGWPEKEEIPGDTDRVRDLLCWNDGEAHSPSWFTLEEAEAWTPTFEYGDEQFARWLEYMRFIRDHFGLTSADVRVVFGFDN